ncbi:P-loop containing nucleoside triphosphate hydrolase protein [Lentinula aciculospora]|uniref:ATP-dependent RNA helicase n=1 Tax=Lentinula aciculospora TaxID=153920 RepID=A0A9W9DK21_9AGAR|nr:P-loop containing nucleoside triphosphate hydrolase protein [Lentinula aciculospora]
MLRLLARTSASSSSILRITNQMPPRFKKPKIQHSASTATLSTATPTIEPASPDFSRPASSSGDRSHFSDRKFQDLAISLKLKQNIKHEFLTEVQAATIEPALAGSDLLVQAKTGTGKTIAFLLPAIEKALQSPKRVKGTPILVLSPTRELAQQISKEAQTLLPQSDLRIITVTGGTSSPVKDLEKFLTSRHDIVVATPGRLHDYFTGSRSAEVHEKFNGLQTLVLDEVDRLLDGGFARELDGVVNMLPKTKRQNLFFSATISNNIKQVAKRYNDGSEYVFVSTLKGDEMNVHQHVHQSYIIARFENHIPTLLALLHLDSIKHALPQVTTTTPPNINGSQTLSKVMVFFPTARHVSFATEVLSSESIKKFLPPILEIHSRKSQSARTKAAEAFKNAKSAILLSSDVAARGIDFPGVTLVIQIGIPSSAEQYVHRLGRTARAGAQGQGIILLDPQEQPFLTSREMQKTTTITPYITSPSSHEAKELATYTQTYTHHVQTVLGALATNNPTVIGAAYVSFLGYYKGQARILKWSSERLVDEANMYAKLVLGWTDALPPPVMPKTVGMMGLKGVRGLHIVKPSPSEQSRGNRRR